MGPIAEEEEQVTNVEVAPSRVILLKPFAGFCVHRPLTQCLEVLRPALHNNYKDVPKEMNLNLN